MFSSSLSPVVSRRTHVIFTIFVCVCVWWCPTQIVLCCVLFVSVLCVQCCQILWIAHSWLPDRFSLVLIRNSFRVGYGMAMYFICFGGHRFLLSCNWHIFNVKQYVRLYLRQKRGTCNYLLFQNIFYITVLFNDKRCQFPMPKTHYI